MSDAVAAADEVLCRGRGSCCCRSIRSSPRTTTASSYRAWLAAAAAIGLAAPTKLVCCYPTEPWFVASCQPCWCGPASRMSEARTGRRPRLLFSAHGLPMKIVERGDPYPSQVEQIRRGRSQPRSDWPRVTGWICYQSRVVPAQMDRALRTMTKSGGAGRR